MKARFSRRGRAGHLLVEALVGGVLLSLTLAAISSGEVAASRSLTRGIAELELERALAERIEYLRAQPPGSPAWTAPSGGTLPGHPDWAWSFTPEFVEDLDVQMGFPSFRYLRVRVTLLSPEGRTLTREVLQW